MKNNQKKRESYKDLNSLKPSVYRFFSGLKRGFCWCFWGGFLLVVFRFLFVCFKTLFFVF